MKKPRRVTEKQHPRYPLREAKLSPFVVVHVQHVPFPVAVTKTSCHNFHNRNIVPYHFRAIGVTFLRNRTMTDNLNMKHPNKCHKRAKRRKKGAKERKMKKKVQIYYIYTIFNLHVLTSIQ
jgi:hypothetical protein